MRAFTKAAALLSLTPALAFVIPDLPGLSTPPSNSVVEYREAFPGARPTDELTVFRFFGPVSGVGHQRS